MNNKITAAEIVANETKRLAEQYGKSFLDCEDIIQITGLGRDNVRALMKSKDLPVKKIGKRHIVGIANFVAWQMTDSGGDVYGN